LLRGYAETNRPRSAFVLGNGNGKIMSSGIVNIKFSTFCNVTLSGQVDVCLDPSSETSRQEATPNGR
jgi:hypothetical protein